MKNLQSDIGQVWASIKCLNFDVLVLNGIGGWLILLHQKCVCVKPGGGEEVVEVVEVVVVVGVLEVVGEGGMGGGVGGGGGGGGGS